MKILNQSFIKTLTKLWLLNQSFIKTLTKLWFQKSKFHSNFDSKNQSYIKLWLINHCFIKVSNFESKLWFLNQSLLKSLIFEIKVWQNFDFVSQSFVKVLIKLWFKNQSFVKVLIKFWFLSLGILKRYIIFELSFELIFEKCCYPFRPDDCSQNPMALWRLAACGTMMVGHKSLWTMKLALSPLWKSLRWKKQMRVSLADKDILSKLISLPDFLISWFSKSRFYFLILFPT